MMLADDLPWPELGNVSRGATRGNQGQKGVLSPPDHDGRCLLQLRVQPGVLAVRLNRQASEWYRILDGQVARALKLTKTYWRKARRRQDYDARADQDHMELHEWLQQLKDKTMSHLELLMQKGDIQGPPYTMPDDLELTFLRGFIERQAAGIPHNPRLRKAGPSHSQHLTRRLSEDSSAASEPLVESGPYSLAFDKTRNIPVHDPGSSHTNASPLSLRDPDSFEAYPYNQAVHAAKERLSRVQKDMEEALATYTSCLEAERLARQEVAAAVRNRDEMMQHLLSRNQTQGDMTRHSASPSEDQTPSRYHAEDFTTHAQSLRHPQESLRPPVKHGGKPIDWSTSERPELYPLEPLPRLDPSVPSATKDPAMHENRKHVRSWDRSALPDGQDDVEGLGTLSPPRKRMHQMMGGGFDVFHMGLPSHNISLSS